MAPGDGNISIDQALELLTDGTVRGRVEGIDKLLHIFKSSRHTSALEVLRDGAYHAIYEALFKIAFEEKSIFLSAKSASMKSKSEKILTSCSDALRLTLKAGARKLKPKTLRAVIEHVTQLLPVASGDYCAGMSDYYLKVLGSLLEYEPHVEHLEIGDWLTAVDFCLQGIKQYDAENDPGSAAMLRSFVTFNSVTKSSHVFDSRPSRRHTTTDNAKSVTKRNAEDLMQCLLLLLSAPNAPILDRGMEILQTILQFLSGQDSLVTQIHQTTFSALNLVLSALKADHFALAQYAADNVITIIARLWSLKLVAKDEMLNSAKDEMLTTILLLSPFMERIVRDSDDGSSYYQNMLQDVQDTLICDYSRRLDRDRLQIDDLDIVISRSDPINPSVLDAGYLSLRPYAARAEKNWAIIKVLSILDNLLHLTESADNLMPENSIYDGQPAMHSRKRRRTTTRFDDLLDRVQTQNEGERLIALQTLLFTLPSCQLTAPSLHQLLDVLVNCLGDRRCNIAAWAMLCIASCTPHFAARDSLSASFDWRHLWHTATRLLTLSTTCRVTSYMLHTLLAHGCVLYQDITEEVNAILTMPEIHAPTVICDSSLSLMAHLLRMRNKNLPGEKLVPCQQTIRWLSSKWNPVDKVFAAQCAVIIHPIDILNLLCACLDINAIHAPRSSVTPSGRFGQVWSEYLNNEKMIRFLLLLDQPIEQRLHCPVCGSLPMYDSCDQSGQSPQTIGTRELVAELMYAKFAPILQEWQQHTMDQPLQISTDTVRCTTSTCIAGCLLLSLIKNTNPSVSHKIEIMIKELTTSLVTWIPEMTESQDLVDAMFQAIHPYLPNAEPRQISSLSLRYPHLMTFLSAVGEALHAHDSPWSADEPSQEYGNKMDWDDIFDSYYSSQTLQATMRGIWRRDSSSELSVNAFHVTTCARLVLISLSGTIPEPLGTVPSSFFTYLLELPTHKMLMSRRILQDIFDSGISVDIADAAKLVKHLGGILTPEFSSCEVALGLCLDVLAGLVPMWSTPDTGELADSVLDLYTWFINVIVPERRPSPHVQIKLASLFFELLRRRPDYGESRSLPSVRSCLFDLLQKGPLAVKFYIGERLPDLFSLFVLQRHNDVLVDLLDSLPLDADWTEGIAFRLRVLSLLASRWSTLLRGCVYYILEVSGKIPKSVKYAKTCLHEVSVKLHLTDPRGIFRLFASQLLYTWLETETFQDIPYEIFSYDSLQSLLRECYTEIAGLMVMRNQDAELNNLAETLNVSVDSVLQESFTKVMAYCIAYDISVPQPESEQKYIAGEVRVRKSLGKELFFKLVNNNFADILGTFLKMTEQEEQAGKTFARVPALKYAAHIMQQMSSIIEYDAALPPGSQPTFKVKYLASQIEHLCKRTDFEMARLFKPSLVVFLARSLLRTHNSALGPLHACSVLRKLRVLIALAGDTALEGYPLQMLLHSVRHFITDTHCVQDAIGILQYLLERGFKSLRNHPTFMAGMSLSILACLRKSLDSGKASTTQESQYRSSLSRTQAFHKWLGLFLKKYYEELATDSRTGTALWTMVQAAHGVQGMGNAVIGTSEGKLLHQLLEDERSGRDLLSKPFRHLIFSLFYSNFEGCDSFRTDIFGDDENAVAYATTVWGFCQSMPRDSLFLVWAGKTLGRAFAATGTIQGDLKECNLKEINELAGDGTSVTSSRTCLLHLLQLFTLDECLRNAGVAETTLRVIVSRVQESTDAMNTAACEEGLADDLLQSSFWAPYDNPPSDLSILQLQAVNDPYVNDGMDRPCWILDLTLSIAQSVPSDPIIFPLQLALREVSGFAEQAFPLLLHLVLSAEFNGQQTTKRRLSTAMKVWLSKDDKRVRKNIQFLINALIFLRTQPLPQEASIADRMNWLDVDCAQVAEASIRCGMYKTALLFTEISESIMTRASRRSTIIRSAALNDTLRSIYVNIDDPDMFYGLEQSADLDSISARLEYERSGLKSLMFRGAQYDSHLRQRITSSESNAKSIVHALSTLSLDGLAHTLFHSQQTLGMDQDLSKTAFETARKLEQWDLPVPTEYTNDVVAIYQTFQTVNSSINRKSMTQAINAGISSIMSILRQTSSDIKSVHSALKSLAVLTEMDEVLSSTTSEQFEEMLEKYSSRSIWMKNGNFEDVNYLLSCRQTLLSCLGQQGDLRNIINVSLSDNRLVQVQTDLLSANLNRAHGAFQETLKLATHLKSLVEPCHSVGLSIEAASQLETANALWDQGEMASSIAVLQSLEKLPNIGKQSIAISKSDLLAKIACQVSIARLEKPDRIVEKYLVPALKELRGKADGKEAGQVFHDFAVFCDGQFQDPDSLGDLDRLKRLKEMKESEVRELGKMTKAATTSDQKNKYHGFWVKAKQWLQLDNEEFRRLSSARDELLRQSLENYLLSLAACDDFFNDALRFSALWLEHSEEDLANLSVDKHVNKVPSWKFASLANQLTSRLLDTASLFQQLLFSLVLRICKDHPYHGMYQIWAGSKSRSNTKDEVAKLRNAAASKVGQHLAGDPESARAWSAINNTNRVYCQFAAERDETRLKAGQKIALKNSPSGSTLSSMFPRYPIPPPTLQIEISTNRDYSHLPTMYKFEAQISIASGVSAPKIVTVVASDGSRHKQLVKGGTDDLRQDAIMEQVFSQVNELLKLNTETRQRDLRIRTYKVLPLSSHAGIIEFVSDTIPLHEYLMPAHERYHPKDLKGSQCRKQISDVQTQKLENRLKTYRTVTDQFHPVLRYFFMERFNDPDDWFSKRLAYTRSTAAISMLGHVLGLGDRHGHNILLDEKTGEVVHIDLGVAFETGRVLPVPELVPFRLTRDIEDGMGISRTEGVFRRCCEYTLDAMRREAYGIMTILDVLRYDPLYTWSISPVRLAKLQDAQSVAPLINSATDTTGGNTKSKGLLNELGEADRALTVVRKKLSKTLSVTATVNELINQATDFRNLAVLYAGWAAYA